MMRLDVRVAPDGAAVVAPEGRLNMHSAPRLRAALEQLVAGGTTTIVVDLAATAFVDSSGLGALVTGLRAAESAGGGLRVARPSEEVSAVLELTRLDGVLRPLSSLDA
jgi:anti-sigma B factor antagonist